MLNNKHSRYSELLQLILLDNLYAQSGSERLIFQGGTALRWVYGGARFSEDLDFVTDLPQNHVEKIVKSIVGQTEKACVAQFGPGQIETKKTGHRKEASKLFFVYRPEKMRERIAVKMEFEALGKSLKPDSKNFILRDLSPVSGLITTGELIMPYSSSIIVVETQEEILSDKIRALYERTYIKGRDIYDIWWLYKKRKAMIDPASIQRKITMYQIPFVAARTIDYFQSEAAEKALVEALRRDLTRFLPQNIFSEYEKNDFVDFIDATKEVTANLMQQGFRFS